MLTGLPAQLIRGDMESTREHPLDAWQSLHTLVQLTSADLAPVESLGKRIDQLRSLFGTATSGLDAFGQLGKDPRHFLRTETGITGAANQVFVGVGERHDIKAEALRLLLHESNRLRRRLGGPRKGREADAQGFEARAALNEILQDARGRVETEQGECRTGDTGAKSLKRLRQRLHALGTLLQLRRGRDAGHAAARRAWRCPWGRDDGRWEGWGARRCWRRDRRQRTGLEQGTHGGLLALS